jgi:predicted DsbA family dithiol-disulfide isomerase
MPPLSDGPPTIVDMDEGSRPTSIDVHIDIMCPFAFQASLWLRELQALEIVKIRWRYFSLEEINRTEGKPHPWERDWSYGFSMMRIGCALDRQDPALWDAWYLKAGTALHVEGRKPHSPDVARQLLVEMELDPSVVDRAIADSTTSDEVRADHERLADRGAFGVPTIVFDDDQMLFGPVLIDPPRGDEAIALWRLVEGWRAFPHLYELKRPKSRDDLKAIGQAFTPYFQARDWKTIQNPAP